MSRNDKLARKEYSVEVWLSQRRGHYVEPCVLMRLSFVGLRVLMLILFDEEVELRATECIPLHCKAMP